MRIRIFHSALITLLMASLASAQLSPGDLVKAHAHLEGIRNCTQCHNLMDKVSEDKCLDCHKELKQRIDQNQGFHVSREVKTQSCISCHSDHHGRNFDIVHLDQKKFDHNLTGYKLEGAHREQDCASCHKTEFITSNELKEKNFTFLGLSTDCIACHDDVHQNTLSTRDCASCHNFEAFAPAKKFDHSDTDFPLKGKHKEVDCKECHPLSTRNGKEFQAFAGIQFDNCTRCHEDPHDNAFGQNCTECHTEESFHLFVGMNQFNHSRTGFPLNGKHRSVNCIECHTSGATGKDAFHEFSGKSTFACNTCHDDVHEDRFGNDCAKCHTEQSFRNHQSMQDFDHGLTAYPLEGKHLEVDCKKCHTTPKMIDPLPFGQCMNCHEDFHKGQIADNSGVPDCVKCHSVQGFGETSFTIEDHMTTSFPLDGAHLATPCISCHLPESAEQWQFADIGTRCVDCHEDIHTGIIDAKFYPQQECRNCHTVNTWDDQVFDHSQTNFVLEGVHAQTNCYACHLGSDSSRVQPLFAGLETSCNSCHEDIHHGQFAVEGATDCVHCHGFTDWNADKFDHNSAAFILEGAHKDVACAACHKEIQNGPDRFVEYKMKSFECADCHQ